MRLRPAVRADRGALALFPATAVVRARHPSRREDGPRWWEEHAQALVRQLRPPARGLARIVVAVSDERVVGVAHWALDPDGPDVRLIAVHRDHQRRGVGGALLDAVVADVEAGAPGLVASASAHRDNAASRALLVSRGFAHIETVAAWAQHARLSP